MKKFLSYLLIFIMTMAVSATITIRVKSNLLENSQQVSTTASASGEATLLGGIMESLEENPKLNLSGNITVGIDEEEIGVELNVNADLTVLTSPIIDGTIDVTYGGQTTSLYLCFINNTIYVECENIKIKTTISGITDIVNTIKEILPSSDENSNSALGGLGDKFANINVDSLLDALGNPKKTVMGNLTAYEVNLDGICKAVIVCDDDFNIKTATISDFTLIEGVSVEANIAVNADENIDIVAPDGEHLDVAAVISDIESFIKNQYFDITLWASVYKNTEFLEYAKANVKLDAKTLDVVANANISGLVDGKISAAYINKDLYAKFNDIGVKANKSTIEQLISLVMSKLPQDLLNVNIDTNQIIDYVKNNYKTIISNAVISNSKIKIDIDLSFLNEKLGRTIVCLNVYENKIRSIDINLSLLGEYKIVLSAYVYSPESVEFKVDEEEYFDGQTILDFITNTNFKEFSIAGDIAARIAEEQINLDLSAKVNLTEKSFQAQIADLFGLSVNAAYVNDNLYANINDIYVSASKTYLLSLIENIELPEIDMAEITNKFTDILKNYSINDILKLVNISLLQEKLSIDADLSLMFGENLKIKLDANVTSNSIELNSFEIEYENICVSGNLSVVFESQEISVENAENYINIENLIDNVQSYIDADNLAISFDVSVQKLDETLAKLSGDAFVNIEDLNLSANVSLENPISIDAKLSYVDGNIYLVVGAQKFKLSKETLGVILAEFDIDIVPYIEKVEQIAQTIKSININEFISEFIASVEIPELGDIDLSNLDLSILHSQKFESIIDIIKNIKVCGNVVSANLTINDVAIDAQVKFGDSLDVAINVQVDDLIIDGTVNVAKQDYTYVVEEDYVDLSLAAEDVVNIINLVKNNSFVGSATVKFGDKFYETINLDFALNINLEEKLITGKINAEIAGIDVEIIVIENVLYLHVKDAYIKATIEDIKDILSSELVVSLIGEDLTQKINLENIDIDSIISKVLDFINEQEIITSLTKEDDKLNITILDKFNITLSTTNSSAEVAFAYNNITVAANIEAKQFETVTVEEDKYVSVADVYALAQNVYNYIKAEEFYFDVNVKINDYEITGYVGFDQDGICLNLSSTILNQNINLKVVNKTIYVELSGLKVKLSFEDAKEMFAEIVETFNLDINESIMNIIDYVLTQDISLEGLIEQLKSISNVDINVEELISSLELSLTNEKLVASVLGANIEAVINNNHISSVSANYETEKLALEATLGIISKQNIAIANDYANIGDAKNIIGEIKNLIDAKSFAGTVSIKYKELIDVDASFVISVDEDKNISAQIVANFYGLDVCITYVQNTLYVQIKDVKVKLAKEDLPNLIAWINESFDKDIEFNFDEFDISSIGALLDKIDFDSLSLVIAQNTIEISYKDLAASVQFENGVSANITYNDLIAELSASASEQTIAEIDKDSYLNYTVLTNFIDSIMTLIKEKKFAMQATAVIHEGEAVHYTATAKLQINLENFAMNAYVQVVDILKGKTHTIKLTYKDNYWWINYNNLKIKMIDTDVNEILALALKLFDIDPSKISFLKDASYNVDDVNIQNLSAVIPKLNMESPLDLLKYLDDLTLTQNKLTADVNGAMVTTNDNATNMQVIVETNGTKLTHIITNNLYTGVTNAERLDLDISVVDFAGIDNPDAGNYLDLSGSNELIKALVNTAELNYYEVDGSVNVTGNLKILFNIPINLTDIPLNLKVKLDENRKPIIKITLGEIPYVPFVTEEKRMVYIYYQDSYVYFQTVSSSQERRLKAHIDSVMDDILYYLQFATGFTDTIMDAIRDSIEANANHEPDLGKIINSYQVVDSKNFKISLNMGEISGDSKIGDMNIDIGVVNNSSTGYKNYIGTGSMNIYMPLSSVFTMTISTNTLKLINIGKAIDFASIESFINGYSFAESIIATKKSNSWSTETGKTYTINFEENGGTAVTNISAAPGQSITLPTPNKTAISGGDKVVYEFLGWWEDTAMVHTEYTESVMSRKDITLYAKWGNPTYYHTISYYVDSTKVYAKQDVEGTNLLAAQDANVPLERVIEDGNHKYYQQFEYFVDENGNKIEKIGQSSQNVYAKYVDVTTLNKHSVSVNTGVASADKTIYVYNTQSYADKLPTFNEYVEYAEGVTRTYRFDGWFANSEFTQEISAEMPDEDITVYAKWTCIKVVYENRLTIYDNTSVVFNELIEVGAEVILPTTINYGDTTKWYYDSAYTNEATIPSVMPQNDITLYIRNKYTLTINYVVVSGSSTTNKNTITGSYYQGESVSLPSQTNYVEDDGNTRKSYTFAGYSENLSVMSNINKTIVGTWNLDVKHYYTVSFDLRWYIVLGAAAGSAWKNAPSAIASIKVLEGTVIDLTQSKYQVTGVAYTTAIHTSWATKNTYKSTTWGTSAWGNYTSGGSGFTSYTVTQNQTLYACWKKV